jgi:hypothetical protein
MRVTRYFLAVILFMVLSTDAFAQDPSTEDALAAFCKKWTVVEYCKNVEVSDIRVGKQLEIMGMKYWPVKAKGTYRNKAGGKKAGEVEELEWKLFEDGFGGYEAS